MINELHNRSLNDLKLVVFYVVFFLSFYSCQQCNKGYSVKDSGKIVSVRNTITLSENWKFQIDIKNIGEDEQWYSNDFSRESWGKVNVPQAWDTYETALWGYEGLGWYSTTIKPDDFIPGNHTEIIFNRVMFYSRVWLNGKFVGENIGGYLPFTFDITGFLEAGKPNHLVIRVDNKPRIEWLPAGKQIEWIQYGGILEPVKLVGTSHTYIDDLTIVAEPEKEGARITCSIIIANETGEEKDIDLVIELWQEKTVAEKSMKVHCKSGENTKVKAEINLDKAELWSPESPALYHAKLCLLENENVIDDLTERFGIRKISVSGNSILLNGEPLIIKGVNRYDEYGRMGPVVPEDTLRKEMELMKSVGINTIRVHYPQTPDLLSLYDEYGFMMMEEIPLNWWGRTNWGEVPMSLDILDFAKPELIKMIHRDKNHPCVIIWSVANECETDREPGITVLRELIRLARSLDSTRIVTFTVSRDPREHLAFDEADIVCFNKYNGVNESKHISDIDSLGYKRTVEDLALYRSFYVNKPIIMAEYGCTSIKNIRGDVFFSEDFHAAYIERIWEAITGNPGISGGILWSWADYYHRKYFINYAVYGPYGVVTIDRKPKKALEALARMYGGNYISE